MEPFDTGTKQSVYFIVKNVSSINRIIKIFNTKIGPQQQLDLMMIPGVSEEDIRTSLLKGQIKQLLDNKTIQIVKSTIGINSSDTAFVSYLSSNGVKTPNLIGTNVSSVIAYGADPTGASDSSSFFQQAITALAGTGMTLYIPAGSYLINTAPTTLSGVSVIRGSGATFTGTGATAMRSLIRCAPIQTRPLVGLLANGQSLGVGTHGVPVITTTQPATSSQLHDSSENYTTPSSSTWSTIPLIAAERSDKWQNNQSNTSQYPTNINGESPDVTMANALTTMMPEGQYLTSNTGQAGASYTIIEKGGTGNAYQSLLNEAQAAINLGNDYTAGFAMMTHGEADWGFAHYDRFVLIYQAQLQTDIQAITSQSTAIPLVYNQQNSEPPPGSNPPVGQLSSSALQQRATSYGISVLKSGSAFAYDSGAFFGNTPINSNASIQCVVPDASTACALGLCTSNAGANYTTFKYCFLVSGSSIEIFENNVYKGAFSTTVAGDTIGITVSGTTVSYQHNGSTIYTSATAASFPLYVQVSLQDQWLGLTNMVLSTGPLSAATLIGTGIVCDSSKMLLSGPTYYLPYYTDRVHLTAQGYQMLGEQYARAAYRYTHGGWSGLTLLSAVRSTNTVTLTFNVPVGPLVFDTAHISPHLSGTYATAWSTAKGFEAWTGGIGGTVVTISSVTIQNGNQVVITCATQPDTIAYAMTEDSTDSTKGTLGFPDGRCGLLHDSDPFVGPITGIAQANWCPAFVVSTP